MSGFVASKEAESAEEPASSNIDRLQEIATEYVPGVFDMDQLMEWRSYSDRRRVGSRDVVGGASDGGRAGAIDTMNYFFTGLDAVRGVSDLANPDTSVPDKVKAGVGLGSELLSMIPGYGHVAPAITAGTQIYDETIRGSAWLREMGVFGTRDGEHRDAAEAASDAASAFGSQLHFDGAGFSQQDGGVLGDIVAWPALMTASTVTGIASALAGSARTVGDTFDTFDIRDEGLWKEARADHAKEALMARKIAKGAQTDGLGLAILSALGHNAD